MSLETSAGEPRIAVLGTGANGASIAADLTRAGNDVTLIDQWPAHVEAMRDRGIRVEMPDETIVTPVRTLHLCDVATLRDPFDVVFLVVKAYDSRWASQLIEPHLAPKGVVIGLQNGMTVDDVAAAVGPERTLGGVIEVSSAMYQPGVIERHSAHSRSWFAVGSSHVQLPDRERQISGLLSASGTVEIVGDIMSAKWMKLALNAAELVPSAILGVAVAEAAAYPGMRSLMLRAGREALDAAIGTGHRLVPIFGLESVDPHRPDLFVEAIFDMMLDLYVLPHTRSTVLQDWMKGRKSEVDEINGRVVRELAALGQKAPVNAAATEIAHKIERKELAPGLENFELFSRLSDLR
jgi:2-dehydropantoate 2-reductase